MFLPTHISLDEAIKCRTCSALYVTSQSYFSKIKQALVIRVLLPNISKVDVPAIPT